MNRLRVLVVEDSLTVRMHLCEILGADSGIDVIGQAEDGKQAIELCQSLRPDVITLDMMLPVMSGLAATEFIMAYCPTPILVVSSSLNRGELFKTYEALGAGAVEVMEKPRAEDSDGDWERRFIAMVKLVARVKVVTHLRGRLNQGRGRSVAPPRPATGSVSISPPPLSAWPPNISSALRLVAIGASTGGPRAIVDVLRALPPPFPLPVLIVIHIGEAFGAAFAEWLDGQTSHKVQLARDGQPLPKHGIFLAPPERHMIVQNGRLVLTSDAERHSCRPSVDVLFESIAAQYGAAAAACILTGMGHDGARGLLAIRSAGGLTIAQDEASSVVYGMPREAVMLGAAQRVLPLADIGPALAALTNNVK